MSVPQRVRIIAVLAVVVAVAVFLTGRGGGESEMTASGTVEATDADLGFQLPGKIDLVLVAIGDPVAAGDTLAQLDLRHLDAQRRSANAQVTMARARLAELETGFRSQEIAQGRAGVESAARRRSQAEADLARTRTLFEGGALARELLDHHQTAFDVADAEHFRAQQALAILEEGPRTQQIAAARAAVEQALAAVDGVDAALAQARIDAPFAGLVSNRHREPGEIVPAGAPVLTIMNPASRWVRIYVREDAVGRIGIGQTVSITSDAYPDRTYSGEVVFIADEAEFTPRNVQTTEERIKLVFEVRVRIVNDESFDLKPGLPADVDLQPVS